MQGPMTVDKASSSPFVVVTGKPSGRSMLGKQADSRKSTAPQYTFNNVTNREGASKTFVSAGHLSVEKRCREGPGPVYNVPGALEKQVEGQKTNAPQFSMNTREERLKSTYNDVPGPGTYSTIGAVDVQPQSLKVTGPRHSLSPSKREQRSKMFVSASHTAVEAKGTLGVDPGMYNTIGSIGAQPLSSKRNGPSFTWGHGDRLKDEFEKARSSLPPVGKYETWHSLGKQTLSTFKTLPAFNFGRCTGWSQEEKRFLTLGHTKELQGAASPANFEHQTAQNMTSFGKQVLSQRPVSQQTKFGTSPKMVFKTNDTPGPGSYD